MGSTQCTVHSTQYTVHSQLILEMKLLALVFILVDPILQTTASSNKSEVCSPVEKVYASHQFGICRVQLVNTWCYKGDQMSNYQAKFFKEYEPDKFLTSSPACAGYQSTCQYLRFLTQVCGAVYTRCHTQEERKLIIRIWIKQFLREVVFRVGRFEDDGVDMKSGKCNDILTQFFDENELKEMLDMIKSPDFKKGGFPRGYNTFSNITVGEFGVLKDEDGDDISIEDMSKNISSSDSKELTLPSHWEYCEYQVAKDLPTLSAITSDLWRCDGKCNTNNGDDQAWYKAKYGMGGMYRDLNTGEFHGEQFKNMHNLIRDSSAETMSEKGIFGCLDKANDHFRKVNTCKKFETFVENCIGPVDKCFGNIAIKEVVMTELTRTFGTFTLEECNEVSQASLVSSTWIHSVFWLGLAVLCFI